MQTDTISRLQHMSSSSSSVKTPSPLKGVQLPTTQPKPQSVTNNLGQLDNIFQSVKKQVKIFFFKKAINGNFNNHGI